MFLFILFYLFIAFFGGMFVLEIKKGWVESEQSGVPHHHHPTQTLLHAQKGTLFQHLCSSKDLDGKGKTVTEKMNATL